MGRCAGWGSWGPGGRSWSRGGAGDPEDGSWRWLQVSGFGRRGEGYALKLFENKRWPTSALSRICREHMCLVSNLRRLIVRACASGVG